MKLGALISSLLAVVWVLLALLQLWFSVFSLEVFLKISVTLALLLGIVVVLSLVVREYLSDKKLKEDGYIDE